jgi:integrase
MTTTSKKTNDTTKRYGPTKDGVRLNNRTGVYEINKWIGTRAINESTGCTEFREAVRVAQKRLMELRDMAEASDALPDRNAAMSVVIERWKFDLKNLRATPEYKKAIGHCLNVVLNNWPHIPDLTGKPRNVKFEELRPAQISTSDLNAWKSYVMDEKGLSNSYVNRVISAVLKSLFSLAAELGLIAENKNPMRGNKVKREENNHAVKDIRSLAQIEKILAALGGCNALVKQIMDDPRYRLGETQTDWMKALDENPEWKKAIAGDETDAAKIRARIYYFAGRAKKGTEDYGQAQHVRDLVEGLAFSGLRIGEARRLKAEHVDLQDQILRIVEGVAEKGGIRTVPINHPRQLALFTRLHAEANGGNIFKVQAADRSLERACADAKQPKLTHHGLRHFFASWLLLQDINLSVVAEILGHHDNGVLAAKLYCHVLDEMRRKQVAKLSAPANVVTLPTAGQMSVQQLEGLLAAARAREQKVA